MILSAKTSFSIWLIGKLYRRGKERKGKERKEKERKGEERKGKERKGRRKEKEWK